MLTYLNQIIVMAIIGILAITYEVDTSSDEQSGNEFISEENGSGKNGYLNLGQFERVRNIRLGYGRPTKNSRLATKPKQKDQFCRTPSKSTAGQCPCIKEKGRRFCAAYNPTYFAATIEEAIFNFKDTTNPNSGQAKTLKPDPKASSKKKLKLCPGRDNRCKKCVKYLFDKFLSAAMDISDQELRNSTLVDLTSMLRNAGVSSSTKGECSRLHVGEIRASRPLPPDPLGIKECIRSKGYPTPRGPLPDGTGTRGHNAPQGMWDKFSGPSVQPGGQARHKRQSVNKDMYSMSGGMMFHVATHHVFQNGTSFFTVVLMVNVKTVKRGTRIKSGSTHVGLCNIHWTFGFLRQGLFPKYVNLMTCDEDTRCLSGWGTCRERNRSFQVLEKTSRGYQHEPYSVNAPMACDCQVDVGSAMHSFVQK